MSERARNTIRCIEFSESSLAQLIYQGSHRPTIDVETYAEPFQIPVQVKYLVEYLRASTPAPSTIVVETHYVDRHFIDELGGYYARLLRTIPHSCWRLHLFSTTITSESFDRILIDAPSYDQQLQPLSSWKLFCHAMSDSYLGFIVVRPLSAVPIGRTVLRPLRGKDDDAFPTITPYTIHLAGVTLTVHGLAFSQQDWGLAACATTATWSALQRVARHEGCQAPTPTQVAHAAVRHNIGTTRSVPSSGLHLAQVCAALDHFGFPPDVFTPDDTDEFRVSAGVYLRSGVPLILMLNGLRGGHAVCAVGYRVSPASSRWLGCTLEEIGFSHVFIHDDRLGPYALAELHADAYPPDKSKRKDYKDLAASAEGPMPVWLSVDRGSERDHFLVTAAIPPLYRDMRTSARELGTAAIHLLPQLRAHVTGGQLSVTMFFERAGTYEASLFRAEVDRRRLPQFLRAAAFSRYVGIVRWHLDGAVFLDTIWDTTDRIRVESWHEHLLGTVAYNHPNRAAAEALAGHLGPIASL